MLDIMGQAKNAIEAYNTQLKINAANIANMSVDGYKKLNISFQSVFEKVLNRGTAASTFDQQGGTNPMQEGQGVAISNIGIDFTQGDLATGGNLDLAITGKGLFIASTDDGATYRYTRAGKFGLDSRQNLVTSGGAQLYGFKRTGGITDTSTLVPINLSGETYDASQITWDSDGVLRQSYANGVYGAELPFQIALTSFNNPSGLQQMDGTSFVETMASGAAATPTTPGGNVGNITPRNTEKSNVFYIGETIDSMEAQRAMSANLTVVRMINDLIQGVISKL